MFPLQLAAFEPATDINLPDGFRIEQLVAVENARAMAWGDDGTLFVGTMFRNKLWAVKDVFGPEPEVLLLEEKLKLPTGVAFRDGALYVVERHRLLRFADIESRLDNPPEPEVMIEGLPGKGLHSWKYIAFGPDGKLYMTIGSPCNVCDKPDQGLIVRMNTDGSEREVVARGIRNSVGFAWHPDTAELWFSDNNRDQLGDDQPPGELNRVAEEGAHYGFPFCHGTDIVEPQAEFAALGSCADSVPPAEELGPHVAPLGIHIYNGEMFPDEYRGQVFIAEHGSWDRSSKIGYRVSMVRLDESGTRSLGYEPFADGWLIGEEHFGRPVALLPAPDGSLLVSDDHRGAIYRISYTD
ncbi:MAG: sorbosone dehydrogenase family protein [Gammaproteobacteria bacterium]|nr:PQQ-dependent sugar dehydrogenase [Gammaproteobacteria bacterium]NND53577.1 sorbosone dehydrogenase family protein [Gammaproteobacteria bacterium]